MVELEESLERCYSSDLLGRQRGKEEKDRGSEPESLPLTFHEM